MTQQSVLPYGFVVMMIYWFEMLFDIFVKILLSAKYAKPNRVMMLFIHIYFI